MINSIIFYAQKLFKSEKEQTELDLFFFYWGAALRPLVLQMYVVISYN